MFPVVVIILIIAVLVMVIGNVILWLLGLLVAFWFFAIAVGLLYALHKMDALDVEENKWLLVFPIVMFFLGLGLDKGGVLQVQPLSLTEPFASSTNAVVTWVMLAVVIILLIVDIAVSRR